MSVALVMIVRDEQEVVGRALDSVLPLIDYWIVIDTGSVDHTPRVVQDALRDVPGELWHRDWNGFADARTALLERANVAPVDYALTLDADMTVEGMIPDGLDKDCYYLSIGEGFTWRLPLLTKTGKPWSYKGVTHSYLSCDEEFTSDNLDTLRVHHHAEGRPREEKFQRDIELLNSYLKDHPNDPRSVYYLAQSFKDLGDTRTAAELYGRRAALRGWGEEQFHARYREGQMRWRNGEQEKAVWCLLEAWAFRPTRAEPLRSLAAIYRQRGVDVAASMFDEMADRIPLTTDRLFVETNAYRETLAESDLIPGHVPTLSLLDDDGWMLPSDFYGYLATIVRQHKPRLLVECGSGASTVLLASLQAEHEGRLVSLEHDEVYLDRTSKMLSLNGLTAEIHHCPLGQNGQWQWYTNVPDLDQINMLLVDGPPAWTAWLARYPAVPLLKHLLASNAPVVLDDINRSEEREIVSRWMTEHCYTAQKISHSKGAAALLTKAQG